MVIAITPMDHCALIIPQRRMYSDIRKMFPDASSILVSSGVSAVVSPRKDSHEVPQEQVHVMPQRRTRRGVSTTMTKKKERKTSELYDRRSVIGRPQDETLVGVTVNSASGSCKRRHGQRLYFFSLKLDIS